MLPEILDREGVANYYNVNMATVDKWRKEGRLRYVRIGRKIRFRRSDVTALMNEHHVEDRALYERLGKGETEGAKHLRALVDWLADSLADDLDEFDMLASREWVVGSLNREIESLAGLAGSLFHEKTGK